MQLAMRSQIQTDNGLQLKPWQQVALDPVIRIDELDLIPGQRYIGAIRQFSTLTVALNAQA